MGSKRKRDRKNKGCNRNTRKRKELPGVISDCTGSVFTMMQTAFCYVKIHVLTAPGKELGERSINLTAGECALASQVVSSVGKQDAERIEKKVILAP